MTGGPRQLGPACLCDRPGLQLQAPLAVRRPGEPPLLGRAEGPGSRLSPAAAAAAAEQ